MRIAFAVVFLVASAAGATAGPLLWSYKTRVGGGPQVDGIQVGWDFRPATYPGGPERLVYFLMDVNDGSGRWEQDGADTPKYAPQTVFTFRSGDWFESDQRMPGATALWGFQLSWEFAGASGQTAGGNVYGEISTNGPWMTGVGTPTIKLDHATELQVDGQWARVRFAGVNAESSSHIEMTVYPIDAPAVPEPGTLILGGIAVAGGLGAWRRQKRK